MPAPDDDSRNGPRSLWIFLAVLGLLLLIQLPQILNPAAELAPPRVEKVYITATPAKRVTQIVTLTPGKAAGAAEAKQTRMAGYATTAAISHPRTPTFTPTPRPTATATATAYPTLQPLPPGKPAADHYRLAPWSEADARAALAEAEEFWEGFNPNELLFYRESLLYETFLRFPTLREDPALSDQLIRLKNKQFDFRYSHYAFVHDLSTEPFRRWLESALNRGDLTPANLRDGLIKAEFQKREDLAGFLTATSNALFENDDPVMVFWMVLEGNSQAAFVIRGDKLGAYKVFAITPEWEFFYWGWDGKPLLDIRDLNENGIEEIVFRTDCSYLPAIYEWDGTAFINLAKDTKTEWFYSRDGVCPEVTYTHQEEGSQSVVLTVREEICSGVYSTQQAVVRWNGSAYELASKEETQPEFSVIDVCAIEWALGQGAETDTAVAVLSAAVRNWPAEAEAKYGAGSRDYRVLQLAVWHLRRGEVEQGLALFREVRDAPAAPDAPYTEMARIFLSELANSGYYAAGQAVLQYGYMGPGNFRIDLPVSLALDPPGNEEGLVAWLERNRIPNYGMTPGDFNGDGMEDYLVAVEIDTVSSGVAVYVFLSREGRLLAYPINEELIHRDQETKTIKWVSYRPLPDANQMNVIRCGDYFLAARMERLGDAEEVVVDVLHSIEPYNQANPSLWFVPDWQIDQTAQGLALTVRYPDGTGVYLWDEDQGRLVPSGYSPELDEENIAAAERALFVAGDAERAVRILRVLIDGAGRGNLYLLYLRGLAAEMAGHETEAVQNYYTLLSRYPDSPYALIARRRLEVVE
jgi:hypothetical protein